MQTNTKQRPKVIASVPATPTYAEKSEWKKSGAWFVRELAAITAAGITVNAVPDEPMIIELYVEDGVKTINDEKLSARILFFEDKARAYRAYLPFKSGKVREAYRDKLDEILAAHEANAARAATTEDDSSVAGDNSDY